MVHLVELTRDKPIAWMVMPELIERVKRFFREHAADTDPEMFAESIMRDFATAYESRGTFILVAIDDARVVGHLLAILESYCAKNYVNVLQFEIDKQARIPRATIEAGFQLLEEWGWKHQAVQIRAQAPTEAQARRLRVFYKFEPYRILLRKEI